MNPHEPVDVGAVLRQFVAHPWDTLARRWNYKSAVLSSAVRSLLFFATNLTAGPEAALAAMFTELCLRFATAGFYGAATQAFRRVEPPIHGTLPALVLLPASAHSLELVVHWARETPALAASIGVSMAFTVVSTAFNLFAMRRGVLVVGADGASLVTDLCRMPRLVLSFLAAAAAR